MASNSIIEQGNALFRTSKFSDAIQQYSAALALPEISNVDKLRALNNRSICLNRLEQYQLCVQDCDQILALEPAHKALDRKIRSMIMVPNIYPVNQILAALHLFEKDAEYAKLKQRVYEQFHLIDLEPLLVQFSKISAKYLITFRQLFKRDIKKYHDTWECIEYFDGTATDTKYVICPFDKFAPNEDVNFIEEPEQDKTALTNVGGQPFPHDLYYKMVQGSCRGVGVSNVSFYIVLQRLMKKFTMVYNHKIVSGVTLKTGALRTKDVNMYEIAKGGVVVRNYDKHVWLSFEQEGTPVWVDFMPCQYDVYEYCKESKAPLRIFGPQSTQVSRYEKTDPLVVRNDLKDVKTWATDYQIAILQQQRSSKMQVAFEQYLQEVKLLPKAKLL